MILVEENYIREYIENCIIQRDEDALKELMQSPNGRWFLMRLFDACKLNSPAYCGDTQTMLLNEGKRTIGLKLLGRLQDMGIQGIELKQQAEMEYIKTQQEYSLLASKNLEKEGADEDAYEANIFFQGD